MARRTPDKRPRIGLVGLGAIGSEVLRLVNDGTAGPAVISAVLVRTLPRPEEDEAELQRCLGADGVSRAKPWVGTDVGEFWGCRRVC